MLREPAKINLNRIEETKTLAPTHNIAPIKRQRGAPTNQYMCAFMALRPLTTSEEHSHNYSDSRREATQESKFMMTNSEYARYDKVVTQP